MIRALQYLMGLLILFAAGAFAFWFLEVVTTFAGAVRVVA